MEFPSRLDGTEKNATMEATDTRQSEETISSEILFESDSSDDISTSETSGVTHRESTNLLELQSESCSTDKTSSSQNTHTTNTNEEKECFECSRLVCCSTQSPLLKLDSNASFNLLQSFSSPYVFAIPNSRASV